MKSKKAMLILPVAVVALCAVALIGAGFALQYTGQTSSDGNNVNSTYIKVGSTSYTDTFDYTVYYDTVNTEGDIEYTFNKSQRGYEESLSTYGEAVCLGEVTLTVSETPLSDGRTYENYTLAITHDKAIINGTYVLTYKIGTEETKYQDLDKGADKGASFNVSGAVSKTITIKLYLTEPTDDANPINDVTFTFLATAGSA